ncbi:arginase family protein [Corynebacterium parakroppenstedtii]|uniref:arginase family protein n=1 Tax=Corynebacterium parakroppenstedtii TaxID=2828363 RepID=UPI001C8F9341|nr:arginase family protein [Corynebacterium parakroppenstedtii]MBY0794294.1 arginase family protein [Corynebacterium parakroppenstedtii]
MNTLRLLYPDFVSGGLDTYYFGAELLKHLLPKNDNQPWKTVPIDPPGHNQQLPTKDGIYGLETLTQGIHSAQSILDDNRPDRVITIGGSCLVSVAPFDYLHGLYDDVGIVWIDAHPDVSSPADDYPYAHAMALSTLLGDDSVPLSAELRNKPFPGDHILYVGLQDIFDYQRSVLENYKVPYTVQSGQFLSTQAISDFARQFDHLAVHFDIDVLTPRDFHSTYFADPDLTGDGSGGGSMTMDQLQTILTAIDSAGSIDGLTIAEYLPFDEERLHTTLQSLSIFQ